MRPNNGPRQAAEIFLLRTEAHHRRCRRLYSEVVLHRGRVPEQNDLADGGPKGIVGYDLFLYLVDDVGLVPKVMKTLEDLEQENIERAAVQAIQILLAQIGVEIVDASEYSRQRKEVIET